MAYLETIGVVYQNARISLKWNIFTPFYFLNLLLPFQKINPLNFWGWGIQPEMFVFRSLQLGPESSKRLGRQVPTRDCAVPRLPGAQLTWEFAICFLKRFSTRSTWGWKKISSRKKGCGRGCLVSGFLGEKLQKFFVAWKMVIFRKLGIWNEGT